MRRNLIWGALSGLMVVAMHVPAQAGGAERPFASLKAFEACARDNSDDTCLGRLDGFLAKHPAEAFQAGKLVRLHIHATKALPYFAQALGTKPSAAQCSDPDVLLAIDAGLYLPSDEANAKRARELFGQRCYAAALPKVQKALSEDGGNRYLRANACPVLARERVAAEACTGQ